MKKLLPILLLFELHPLCWCNDRQDIKLVFNKFNVHYNNNPERTGNSYSVSGNNVNTSYTYCSANCGGLIQQTTVTGGVARISYSSTGATTMTHITAQQGVS